MLKNNLAIHFDYLSFSFPLNSRIESGYSIVDLFNIIKDELASVLGFKSSDYGELLSYARYGYEYELSLGQNLRVRFGGEKTMMKQIVDVDKNLKSSDRYYSCNVEIRGQGCREVEFNADGDFDWIKVFNFFQNKGGKATRIDIAIDDQSGSIITLDEVIDCVKSGMYTSSFKSFPEVFTSLSDDINAGKSLYFGKSKGSHMNDKELCIYNKRAERRFMNDSFSEDYWVRYEMRFRNDTADELVYFLAKEKIENIGNFSFGCLSDMLTLKQKTYNGITTTMGLDSVSKFDILESWNIFLNCVNKTKFSTRPKMEITLDKKACWKSKTLPKQNILLDIVSYYEEKSDFYFLDNKLAQVYSELNEMIIWFKTHSLSQIDFAMINNFLKSRGINKKIDKESLGFYVDNLKKRIEFYETLTLPF